jgi:rsbT co-antagonist protein RsbR
MLGGDRLGSLGDGVADQEVSARLLDVLKVQRDALVARWVELAVDGLRGRQTIQELERELGAMFDALLAALSVAGPKDFGGSAYDEVRSILADFSRARARQGVSPRDTAVAVFAVKDAVLDTTQGSEDVHADFIGFSKIIDELGLFTFETYSAAREVVIGEQSEQLLELSTPVVKLWEGVVAVPLVGTLDSARTQVVMEKLLETLVETESAHAIIDITGVPAVDTQVAQHLLKTVVAARLMGAECVISGIRPQIAQTIVALGIEFGDIATKATLADALALALKQSGIEVSKKKRT